MAWTVASGETETVATGERWTANAVTLEGTINLSGQVDLRATADEAGAGSGDAVGTAAADRVYRASNTPVGPWTIPRGETATVGDGVDSDASEINLAGTLNLSGSVSLVDSGGTGTAYGGATAGPARAAVALGTGTAAGAARALFDRVPTASGTGTATATATADAFRLLAASGSGESAGVAVGLFDRVPVARGEGTATGAGTPVADRLAVATATGAASGTAVAARVRRAVALGEGRGVGVGIAREVIPALRRNDADLVYDDTDEFDLSLDDGR